MIHIYAKDNVNFDNHGDMVLTPISCEVEAEINEAWTMELVHPIDDEDRWKYIEVGAVIKAPFLWKDQLFRIIEVTKMDSGVQAKAQPIFMDSMGDCFLMDVRPTDKTGQQALDIILEGSRYTGHSDITETSTAYFYLMNAMEAIAGAENSFLARWGGEIFFDNFDIYVNSRIGADNGVKLLYGKNLAVNGLSETVDTTSVVTRIIPKAFNGRLMTGTQWVDSPLIDRYPTVVTKVIEYQDVVLKEDSTGDEEGKIICDTQEDLNRELTAKAEAEYENGIDKPIVEIDVDMVLLQNTEEYKEYASLERVSLGDTITCHHTRLDVDAEARVVKLNYDCVRDSVIDVTIGQVEPNIMDRIGSVVQTTSKVINSDGNINAEKIEGIINGMRASFRVQNTIAERQDSRAILFEDTDPSSSTYGAMCLGTQGFEIANTMIGGEWQWQTFGTAQGFSADLIVAGTLRAIEIFGVTIDGSTLTSRYLNNNIGVVIENGQVAIHDRNQGNKRGKLAGYKDSDNAGVGLIAEAGNFAYLGVQDSQDANLTHALVSYDDLLKRTIIRGMTANGTKNFVVVDGNARQIALAVPNSSGTTSAIITLSNEASPVVSVDGKIYFMDSIIVKDGSNYRTGADGSFTTANGKTVYVHNGIITSIS